MWLYGTVIIILTYEWICHITTSSIAVHVLALSPIDRHVYFLRGSQICSIMHQRSIKDLSRWGSFNTIDFFAIWIWGFKTNLQWCDNEMIYHLGVRKTGFWLVSILHFLIDYLTKKGQFNVIFWENNKPYDNNKIQLKLRFSRKMGITVVTMTQFLLFFQFELWLIITDVLFITVFKKKKYKIFSLE